MRSYRNLREIKRKETLGRRLSLLGLGILFIGLMASFVPNWYPPDQEAPNAFARFLQENWAWISFAALPLGFIAASVGSYFINRFARRRWPGSGLIARPDEVLERSMKGFDDKYAYFAWSLPANYVVAGPCGLVVFAVRGDRGRVKVQGDKWREPFSIGRLFTVFAREGVGDPTAELQEQIRKLRALLEKHTNGDPQQGSLADIPIEGAAVFLNQQVQLELENPSIPVLRVDQVKEFLRRRAREVRLSSERHRAMLAYLQEQSTYQDGDGEKSREGSREKSEKARK
ncbi:hypothetical protein FKZ61_000010 [Litorilinea aerophila]|uniref:NERD domain-containing protein n=1 Tax=Litorilinea aerophila TaxID=1204385 RepID=A0A540VNR6_9CHLR|nr:hypothetical protein [Litorilinea aerophila]MCC9074500.1 hypothetical protein [Litorilinea aerophila]GIV75644.1 MAG: hypothetical protein KatS3mg050_0038 [Litorilinea sp.]